MGLGKKLKIRFYTSVIKPRYQKIINSENKLSSMPNIIRFSDLSPKRFDIPLEAISFIKHGIKPSLFNKKVMPYAIGSMKGIRKSFKL